MLTHHTQTHKSNFGPGDEATENHHAKAKQVACCCCYSQMTVVRFVIKLSPYSISTRRYVGGWRFPTSVQMQVRGAASHAGNRCARRKAQGGACSRYGSSAEEKITPGGNRTPIPLVLLKILSNEARRAGSVHFRGF